MVYAIPELPTTAAANRIKIQDDGEKKKRVDTLSRKDVSFGRDQTTHGETRQRDVQNERASVKNPVVAWYFVYDLRQCHCNPLLVVLGNQGHAFRTFMVLDSASPYTHRRE